MCGAISASFEVEGARDQVEEIRKQETQRRKRKAEGCLEPSGAWAEHGVVQTREPPPYYCATKSMSLLILQLT